MAIGRVLIANRGEIAVRIARPAARRDRERRGLLGRRRATRRTSAPPITRSASGRPRRRESYLSRAGASSMRRARRGATPCIPATASSRNAPALPRACDAAGLIFVGPPADVMERMGSKIGARALDAGRRRARSCRASRPRDQSDDGVLAAAPRPRLPVLVKASAGGGGKGMRIVRARRRGRRVDRRGAARGDGGVRRRHALRRAADRASAARRDPGLRRRARQRRAPLRARVLGSAPPSEGHRGEPVAGGQRRTCARAWAKPRSRRRARPAIATRARSSSCSKAAATTRASTSSR